MGDRYQRSKPEKTEERKAKYVTLSNIEHYLEIL